MGSGDPSHRAGVIAYGNGIVHHIDLVDIAAAVFGPDFGKPFVVRFITSHFKRSQAHRTLDGDRDRWRRTAMSVVSELHSSRSIRNIGTSRSFLRNKWTASPHLGHRPAAYRTDSLDRGEDTDQIPEINPLVHREMRRNLKPIQLIFHVGKLHIQPARFDFPEWFAVLLFTQMISDNTLSVFRLSTVNDQAYFLKGAFTVTDKMFS